MIRRVPHLSHHWERLPKILTYILLGFWSLVCLFPLYWVAITSIKPGASVNYYPTYLPFIDFTPSLDAWAYILTNPNENLVQRFLNSVVVASASTLITLLIGGMAVYGLTRSRYAVHWASVALILLGAALAGSAFLFRQYWPQLFVAAPVITLLLILASRYARRGPILSNQGILFALLATRILPPIVVVLPIYMMALYSGTLDTRFALIFTYTATNLPVAVWLLLPLFGEVATEQEEAAQLDGASRFGIFFTIFLPMVAASTAAVGLLIFILCWNEYLFAAYLAGNQAMTVPPWIIGQMSIKEAASGSEGEEWAFLSAAMVLMVVPLLAFTAVVQRFLSRVALWNRMM